MRPPAERPTPAGCDRARATTAGAVRPDAARAGRGRRRAVAGGVADRPGSERYDERLLADGDRRNVVDRYRYWTVEAIVADLDTRRHDFHVADRELAARLQHRHRRAHRQRVPGRARCTSSATAGGTAAARWSPTATSTSGTTRRSTTSRRTCTSARCALLGIDNLPGSTPLETLDLPRRVCLLFGQEGPGLSERGPGGLRRHLLDRPVRLDPVDQRLGRRGDRDAHLGAPARRPVGSWRG